MNEFYWITRLDSIDALLTVFAVIAILVFCICLIVVGITYDDECFDSDERAKKVRKYFRKSGILSLICFTLFSVVNTFLPSTEDAYIIYGVGGTFDYLKQSETAKKIPDKVLVAIDAYLDKQIDNLTPIEQSDTID